MPADPAEQAADELYGIAPDEFIAERDRRAQQARADGNRQLAKTIKSMRRPTVSAWAVNLLARTDGDELASLLALGDELREAQRGLQGEALRQLNVQRRQAVAALTRRARHGAAEAGHPLGSEAERQVEQTLTAALADPDIAAEVSAGRLIKPLQYAGMGVEPSASAVPTRPRPRPVSPLRPEGDTPPVQAEPELPEPPAPQPSRDELAARRRRTELERQLGGAREELDGTDADLVAAEDEVDAVEQQRRDAERRQAELERELERLDRALRELGRRGKEAERMLERARRNRDSAQRRVQRLTDQLDELD